MRRSIKNIVNRVAGKSLLELECGHVVERSYQLWMGNSENWKFYQANCNQCKKLLTWKYLRESKRYTVEGKIRTYNIFKYKYEYKIDYGYGELFVKRLYTAKAIVELIEGDGV